MKKTYIVSGIIGLAVVVGLAVFLQKKKSNLSHDHTPEITETAPSELSSVGKPESGAISAAKSESLAAKAPISAEDPKMKKIDAFLVHSRVLDEFKAMDELLEAQLEQIQDASQLSSAENEELDVLRKIVSSEKLLGDYKKLMHEKFNEQELDQLSQIYQDPLIAKVKEAQVYNQTQEGQKELIDYWKTFKKDSMPKSRQEALRAYDLAMGSSESTVKMIKSFADMSAKGANANDPNMKKEQESFEKGMRNTVEEANMIQHSKMFADQTDEQISATTKLVANPVVQKENGVKNEVLTEAIKEVSTHLVEQSEKDHAQKKTDASTK